MTQKQESIFDQITQYVVKNRMISKRITQCLQKGEYSTEHPTFLKSNDISVLVNPEPQRNGKFRVNVAIHNLTPGKDDLSGFKLGIISANGQRITGRNRGRGHTVFENVPDGEFSVENWSVMSGKEECYSRETLLGYIQNWLNPQEYRMVKAHLDYCSDCALLVNTVKKERADAEIIWPVQWLNRRAKEGIESVKTKASAALKTAGEWVQMLLTQEAQLVPEMRTRDGARQIYTVEARIVDELGSPTDQTLSLFVERGPHIEKGRFRVDLSTSDKKYKGYKVQIALQNENGRLELCSIPFREYDDKLTATALVVVNEMFTQEQVPNGYIPIETLDIKIDSSPK